MKANLKAGVRVLDHGYIRLIETWGCGDAQIAEAGIIEAARQSTQGSFRGWEQDEKLLQFLYDNKHATPFEFCGAIIEVQAPIFVFREWHRHRTQSYNEMSARYEPLPDLNYIPTVERIMLDQGKNIQSSAIKGAERLTEQAATIFQSELREHYAESEELYQESLISGIPKELARCCIPVGRYSRMRASANLRNWMGFLTLRLSSHAQWEIRKYAHAVYDLLNNEFPKTMDLFATTQA